MKKIKQLAVLLLVFATASLYAQVNDFGHTCSTDEVELSRDKPTHVGERSATSVVCTGDDHIKYVRVNFHYMQSEEPGNPQNFTAVDDGLSGTDYTGYQHAEEVINMANSTMRKNYYPGNMMVPFEAEYYPPKRVQYILTGVYFDKDDDYYSWDGPGSNGEPDDDIIALYGDEQTTVYNVFLLGGEGSSTGGKAITNASVPGVLIRNAWHNYHNPPNFNHLDGTADNLNHELGHHWGLSHSFSSGNICSITNVGGDINTAANGTPPMWTSGDNNMMGYNTFANSVTPCQLGIIHATLETAHSDYVEFCCAADDWNFALENPGDILTGSSGSTWTYTGVSRTRIIDFCEPDYCIDPIEIVPSINNCGDGQVVKFNLAGYDAQSNVCADWELKVWNANDVLLYTATDDGYRIKEFVPNDYSYQVCVTTCGSNCIEFTSCLCIETANTMSDVPQIDFHFQHADETEDTNFGLCEDVYLDASASVEGKYHYYVLWHNDVFVARTPYLNEGSPADPENLTDRFQQGDLLDWNGNAVPNVIFEAGDYRVQTAIFYEDCEWMKVENEFTIEATIVDFDFIDEDGTIDNEIDICEDIFIDASASTLPVSQHFYTLWELNGTINPEWIGTTDYPIGGPDVPVENVSEAFAADDTNWAPGKGPIIELESGKTYRLKLATYCEGPIWENTTRDFTTVSEIDCTPCVPLIWDFEQQGSQCVIGFHVNEDVADGFCNNWAITRYNSDGEIIEILTGSVNSCSWGTNMSSPFEVCINFCEETCGTTDPFCVYISQEMLDNCEFILGPEPPGKPSTGKPGSGKPGSGDSDGGKSVDLYPNPISNQLFVKTTDGVVIKEFSIFNSMGDQVRVFDVNQVNSGMLDVSQLRPGTYNVRILTTDDELIIKNIVKMQL